MSSKEQKLGARSMKVRRVRGNIMRVTPPARNPSKWVKNPRGG